MSEERAPLDPQQQHELKEAHERAHDILKATKIASFNAWTIGFFAVVSLLFGLVSLTSLVIGIGLAVVSRNEFRGRARARELNPDGFDLMWKNQVGFMALIVAYCLWSMYRVTMQPDPQMAELTRLLGPGASDLVRDLTLLVYAVVIVATGIFQGLNARYYHVRVARLRAYLEETPAWIVDLQRSTQLG